MKTTIEVENLKCGGCANSIHKSLGTLNGVYGVDINMISGKVTVDHTEEVDGRQITDKLLSLGYPVKGTVEGFDEVKASAGSFVNCANI